MPGSLTGYYQVLLGTTGESEERAEWVLGCYPGSTHHTDIETCECTLTLGLELGFKNRVSL